MAQVTVAVLKLPFCNAQLSGASGKVQGRQTYLRPLNTTPVVKATKPNNAMFHTDLPLDFTDFLSHTCTNVMNSAGTIKLHPTDRAVQFTVQRHSTFRQFHSRWNPPSNIFLYCYVLTIEK
ncbi:hypothetical protein V6N11_073975 [Hibiscus sabdariffa]|uniref:Uncharacterized protein n=1 Tax=Hibiscus sabdariffa TaxID=183260 RepID=A0ABR2P570_9ROSI